MDKINFSKSNLLSGLANIIALFYWITLIWVIALVISSDSGSWLFPEQITDIARNIVNVINDISVTIKDVVLEFDNNKHINARLIEEISNLKEKIALLESENQRYLNEIRYLDIELEKLKYKDVGYFKGIGSTVVSSVISGFFGILISYINKSPSNIDGFNEADRADLNRLTSMAEASRNIGRNVPHRSEGNENLLNATLESLTRN